MERYEDALAAVTEIVSGYVDGARASGPVRPGDHVQHDLGLDSMSIMELVADVEARFEISIPKERYDSIATIEDIARAVVELCAARAADQIQEMR